MSEGTTRAVFAAFAGNMLIAITKAVAAAITGSGALVAETAHSIADSLNQILLYVGIRRSVRPASERHPLGHGKERYFWALVVALFLFFGGGVFSLYQSYDRIVHPHELTDTTVGFVVLGLSMIFELFSLSVAVRELRHAAAAEGVPVRRFLSQLRDPALRTVLYEDSAALAGLVAAIVGLALSVWTGDHLYDALASGVIGAILIYVAYQLAWSARGLIVGEAPATEMRDAIRATIASVPEVERVIELRAIEMGTKQLLVLARVSVRDEIPSGEAERLMVRLRQLLKREHPEVMDSYVELVPGMSLVLYHRIDDPESAVVRRRVVELGLKPQVDFQNVDTDGADTFAKLGGRRVPSLWDGTRLHEGRDAVLAALETLRR